MNKYRGIEVFTTQDIKEEQGLDKNQVRSLFLKNQKKMVLNKDYFKLSHDETMTFKKGKAGGYPNGIILYTRSGYDMMMGSKVKKKSKKTQIISPKPHIEKPKKLHIENNKDTFLEVLAADREVYKGIINKQSEQIDSLIKLVSKMVNTPIELPEFKNKVKAAEWYSEINAYVELIHNKTKQDRNVILSNAYKIYDQNYGSCITQCKIDYGKIVGKKPTTLDSIYWYENDYNPKALGILSGILDTMYNET